MTTSQLETRPVLVVGAGPTGLTAALELSRLGIPVRIVDRLTARSTTSRALALQARTLELLSQRGVGASMVKLGNPAHHVTLFDDRATMGSLDLATIPSRYNYILMLSQSETERLLAERLSEQGVNVERGVEMVAWNQDPSDAGGVHAVLRQSDGGLEEVDASWAISAEGSHSSMRTTAGLQFGGDQGNQRYALGDLALDSELPDSQMSIFVGSSGFLAVFPMGAGRFRFISTENGSLATGDPTLEELQGYYDATAHVPARMHDLRWSSRFWVNSAHLDTFRSGRVFFGGDAAHIHSPAGGQGMNTGIQDMINLGWKIALVHRGRAEPGLLDTYDSERLPVIKKIVSRTEAATNALNSDQLWLHRLITTGGSVLLDLPVVKTAGPTVLSEVGFDYRRSPLSETHHPAGRLRGGDRLPDTDGLVSSDGQVQALYDLLNPLGFTLLVTGDADSDDADLKRQLADWPVTVRRLDLPTLAHDGAADLGPTGALTLVRPDAYVAVTTDSGGVQDVLTWLRRWLPQHVHHPGRQ